MPRPVALKKIVDKRYKRPNTRDKKDIYQNK